jgi:predicted ATPase
MSEIPHTNITRLKVKNYRSLADIDIALSPLTVFVGKNAVGKSNVFDVLRFVRDGLKDGFARALLDHGGIRALRYWFVDQGEGSDVSIHLYFEGKEFKGNYGFSFGMSGHECIIKSETLSLTNYQITDPSRQKINFEVLEGQLLHVQKEIDGVGVPQRKRVSQRSFYLNQLAHLIPSVAAVRDFLEQMNFYDLAPDDLRAPQKATNPVPLLENGSNLASALQELQRRKKDYLITQALEVVYEGLEGYSIVPLGTHLITKLHVASTNGHSQEVPSDLGDESDGTIRMLAMLTALYQNRYPSPLVIEEPEKGIYARKLALCGNLLEEATLRYQVLVSTHSPDLIDHLPVDSFLIVEKENDVTKIGPLMSNQRSSIEKKLFSAGEIMQMEGLQREEREGCQP